MRCGQAVEAGGFRWKPEEIHSYKIDYSENEHEGCQGWWSRVKGQVHSIVMQESGVRAGPQSYAIGDRISSPLAVSRVACGIGLRVPSSTLSQEANCLLARLRARVALLTNSAFEGHFRHEAGSSLVAAVFRRAPHDG
jgi:hypothetical protein